MEHTYNTIILKSYNKYIHLHIQLAFTEGGFSSVYNIQTNIQSQKATVHFHTIHDKQTNVPIKYQNVHDNT